MVNLNASIYSDNKYTDKGLLKLKLVSIIKLLKPYILIYLH